jgi:hypothetical protein
MRALPHFTMRDHGRDPIVRRDLHPRRETRNIRGILRANVQAIGRHQDTTDAEQQSAANHAAGADEGTTSPLVHFPVPRAENFSGVASRIAVAAA